MPLTSSRQMTHIGEPQNILPFNFLLFIINLGAPYEPYSFAVFALSIRAYRSTFSIALL